MASGSAQRTARTSTRCTYGLTPSCRERAGEPVVGPDEQRVVARRQPVDRVVREERLQRGLAVGAVERGTVGAVRSGHDAVEAGLPDAHGAERVARAGEGDVLGPVGLQDPGRAVLALLAEDHEGLLPGQPVRVADDRVGEALGEAGDPAVAAAHGGQRERPVAAEQLERASEPIPPR